MAIGIVSSLRAGSDVPDVTLDNLLRFHPVNIAHEFDLNLLSISPPQRKVFVTDIFVLLKCLKGRTISGDVVELTNIPQFAAAEFFKRVIKQINQKWVYVHDLPVVGIENQDPVLGGFKQTAIAQLG